MAVLKMSEWQDGANKWHCADTSNLTGGSSLWWKPVRMLGISPEEYVHMLIDKYKVDRITWLPNGDGMLYFWWEKQSNMRKYKNDMNKIARERKFQV